jgi:uncharacterized membrane protein
LVQLSSDSTMVSTDIATTGAMKFIHMFLVGYFILIVGVGLGLWQLGLLSKIAPIWIVIGVIVAVGVGIMMSVSSGKPTLTEEIEKS